MKYNLRKKLFSIKNNNEINLFFFINVKHVIFFKFITDSRGSKVKLKPSKVSIDVTL